MKLITLLTILLATSASPALGQAKSDGTSSSQIERDLIKLDNKWNEIRQERNATGLDSLLADDFIHTDENGAVTTKAERLENFAAQMSSIEPSTSDDYRIRLLGDVAVMSHRTTYAGGQQERSTHVFVKRHGRWQAIAHHSSFITVR